MRLFVSVIGLSLACATAVFAQTTPDSSAAPAAPATQKPATQKKADGIVCRQETPTGSHFPVKVCTTAAERAELRKQAMRAQEKIQMPSDRLPN